MNGSAAVPLGELQLSGCFPVVSLFVAQELPPYCQRSSLSFVLSQRLQLLGCQLCITNMLSAAICTYSEASRDRRSLGPAGSDAAVPTPALSPLLGSVPGLSKRPTFVTAKPLSSVGSHYPFPALILCPFKPELLLLLICIEWSLSNHCTLNGISTCF